MSEPTTRAKTNAGADDEPPKIPLVLALLLFGALFVSFSWDRDFWAPEESDLAAVTHEMNLAGEWLIPQLAGEPYFEKPPLLYWSGLVSQRLLPFNPHLAYRLPVALFAVLGLWVTYLAGMKFFNRRVALLALFIQGTTALYFRCGSWYLTDVLFSSCVSLSVTAFGISHLWEPTAHRWKVLGYLGLAGACLAKSALLGPYLVIAPLGAFLLSRRSGAGWISEVKRLHPILGLSAVLVLVLPWYVWLGNRYGMEFFGEVFGTQHLGRLLDAESHARPPWYYFAALLADFLPWSFLVPFLVFHAQANFKKSASRFFVLWILVVFVTLSLVSSKQGKYLLPIWTPISVLLAAGLCQRETDSAWEGWLGLGLLRVFPWVLKGLAALLIVVALVAGTGTTVTVSGWFGLSLDRQPFSDLFEGSSFEFSLLALAAFQAAVFFWGARIMTRFLDDDRSARAALALSGCFFAVFLSITFVYGQLNTIKSARSFCSTVTSTTGPRPIAIYGRARGSILYYLDRPVRVIEQVDPSGEIPDTEKPIEDWFGSAALTYLLIIDRDFDRLVGYFPKFESMATEVGSGMVGTRRRYLILANASAVDRPR